MFFWQKHPFVKTPPHPKIPFCWFLAFFWEKNKFPCSHAFFWHKNTMKTMGENAHTPYNLLFSLKNWYFFGKKTKLHCSQAFVVFFYQKYLLSKRPHTLKSCFLSSQFFPSKIHCYIGLFYEKKGMCFFTEGFGTIFVKNVVEFYVVIWFFLICQKKSQNGGFYVTNHSNDFSIFFKKILLCLFPTILWHFKAQNIFFVPKQTN